jgi:2-polyprenyl-3-methyl-5-hydroxy-6-metoxy-1,4-benzoquinol methylase
VFVDTHYHLTAVQEKAEYDLHQNLADDVAYRKFLSRLQNPMADRLRQGAHGLDFGCGPGPVLSLMFEEQGFNMDVYDIFYCDDKSILQQRYDFITATEVIEHLFSPGEVIDHLWGQLLTGGIMGLMTKQVIDKHAFSQWHYKNDKTHVCFFSRQTFNWLAEKLDADLELIGQDVALLSKR